MKTASGSLVIFLFAIFFLPSCATNIGRPLKLAELDHIEHHERYLIGVLPPIDKTPDQSAEAWLDGVYGVFISELQKQARYRVIERERLESIFEEIELSLTGVVDQAKTKEIGKLLGVDALCFANLSSVKNETGKTTMLIAWIDRMTSEITMDARIVDVETGEILATANASRTRGKRQWIAFGFLKWGAKPDASLIVQDTLMETSKELAYQLSQQAPRKR